MNTRYDVAIIGCGEAGIFAGYELKKLRPELNVLVMDQGRALQNDTPRNIYRSPASDFVRQLTRAGSGVDLRME